MWQGIGASAVQGGAEGSSSAMGMYAGYRIGAKADKLAFERQKELMSTAHQLEVEDLRKAGLNPILSAGGSGAHASSVSNTAAGSAMSGADVGQRIGRAMSELNVEEAQARIQSIRQTAAKEKALEIETKERTKAEYGDKKVVGNAQVKMKDGTVVNVPDVKRVPGRVELEKQRIEIDNIMRGVDAAKKARLMEVLKSNPKLLDSWLLLDATQEVSNTAGSIVDIVKPFVKAGKEK